MTLKFLKIDPLTLKDFKFQKINRTLFYNLKSVVLKFEPTTTYHSRVMAVGNKQTKSQISKK